MNRFLLLGRANVHGRFHTDQGTIRFFHHRQTSDGVTDEDDHNLLYFTEKTTTFKYVIK